jgi:DNA-binding response OmpR family regulator
MTVDFKVLLVDDEADHLELFTRLLDMTSLSFASPTTCQDGQSALRMMEEHDYDCVFLDYDLPDLKGVEILRKALELKPDLAVVMVTARGSEEIAVEAMKAGALDYLVKGNLCREALERSVLNIRERRQLKETIREQARNLMEAERQRVMLESIGAACHHFSQPVTSLMGRLELLLMRNQVADARQKEILEECLACTRRIADLISQFQSVHEYRTTPYLDKVDILDIGKPSHPPE